MPRIITILFLILLAQVQAITFKETRRAHKLRISAQSLATAQSVAHYATTCAALVDKTLAIDGAPDGFIDLEETPLGKSLPPEQEEKLFFNEDTEIQIFTYKILRAFIRRRQRELFKNNCPNSALTNFLASALTFRRVINMLSTAGGADWDYAPARKLFEAHSFPNAELLLTAPIPPDYPLFFQLYAMHAEILLKTIEQLPAKRGSILQKLLEMEAFGRDAQESVRYVLAGALPSGMPLQGWYERHAPRISSFSHAGDAPSSISAQVEALETVSILSAGSNGNFERVKIDDVPAAFNDLKTDKVALHKRQTQFLELRNEAPPLLKPSLDLYARAMGFLASQDVKRFKATIAQARQDFQLAIAKQQRISEALKKAETEYVPATRRLGNYLDAMKHYRENRENMLPLEIP